MVQKLAVILNPLYAYPRAPFRLVLRGAASLPEVKTLRCILHGWVLDLPGVAVPVYPIWLAAEP